MDDADDELRYTHLFNALASLPRNIIEDIYFSIRGGRYVEGEGQYIIDAIFELLPELKEWAEMDHEWDDMSGDGNLRIYARFNHKHGDPLELDYNTALEWWDNAPIEVRRQALQAARKEGWT